MQFEYKVEGQCSEARMNELGAQGWELVACDGHIFRFKRPKPQQQGAEPTRELFDGSKAKDATRDAARKR
jgi:hypothetical protein